MRTNGGLRIGLLVLSTMAMGACVYSDAPAAAESVVLVGTPPPLVIPLERKVNAPSSERDEPESPYDQLGGPLYFEYGCDEADERLVVGFAGDVLLHKRLQKQAQWSRERYDSLFSDAVAELLRGVDVMYVNLEGPVAPGIDGQGQEVDDPGFRFDGEVYASYPRFNYHPEIAETLSGVGVDVVSTANNHSLDRFAVGVDLTLDHLEGEGLIPVGTRRQTARRAPFHAITTHGGFRIGWVACTYGISGPADKSHQVRQCRREESAVLQDIRSLRGEVDAVIVTPHWGEEYVSVPRPQERAAARRMLDAGALAVVATHPHVLQPWEKYRTEGRDTMIMHSLGNFVSNQRALAKRSSLVLLLEVSRIRGRVALTGARYVPIHTAIRDHRMRVELIDDPEAEPEVWGHVEGLMGVSNRVTSRPVDFRASCKQR